MLENVRPFISYEMINYLSCMNPVQAEQLPGFLDLLNDVPSLNASVL